MTNSAFDYDLFQLVEGFNIISFRPHWANVWLETFQAFVLIGVKSQQWKIIWILLSVATTRDVLFSGENNRNSSSFSKFFAKFLHSFYTCENLSVSDGDEWSES